MSWQFRFPLPPPTNHAYKVGVRYKYGVPRARMMATEELKDWRAYVEVMVVPKELPLFQGLREPLEVQIRLEVPKAKRRRLDIDGMIKPILDIVIGGRADQWIDRLIVDKVVGDGYAVVTVERALSEALGKEISDAE